MSVPHPPPYRVLLATFPYGGVSHVPATDYITSLALKLSGDPNVGRGNFASWRPKENTPITIFRNQAVKVAIDGGFDFIVMIDEDMVPDLYIGQDGKPTRPHAVPFWESAFAHCLAHDGPCVIGAPYCGSPPMENVFVFHWGNTESDQPNPNFQIAAYSRNEAAHLNGIQEVAALPTGLIIFAVEPFRNGRVPQPWFDYEYIGDGPPCRHCGVRMPGPRFEKASTEDVYISRNMSYVGIKQYCHWSAWAGHIKSKPVGAPAVIPPELIPAWYERSILERHGLKTAPVPVTGPPARPLPYIEITPWKSEAACPVPAPAQPLNLAFRPVPGQVGGICAWDVGGNKPATPEQMADWWRVNVPGPAAVVPAPANGVQVAAEVAK